MRCILIIINPVDNQNLVSWKKTALVSVASTPQNIKLTDQNPEDRITVKISLPVFLYSIV